MADESDNPTWQPERGTSSGGPNGGINVSARLQHLRNYLSPNSNGNGGGTSVGEHQLRLETIEQEISLRSNMLERQRRDFDNHPQDRDSAAATVPDSIPTSNSPSSLVRARRRAIRPSERVQRNRERYNQAARIDSPDGMGSFRRATPPPAFSEAMTDDLGTETQSNREQRYRAKRRKLDDGTFDDETREFSYGDEGRVTPGPLKMEIVRCDGGDYLESVNASPQVILTDDKNLYRTKENKCSMLFKHKGGMPFSLTKIVIKAPSDGFDPSIQEGMIFVGMTDEELLEQTSSYDKYAPRTYRFHHPYRRHDYYRPSQEYLNSTRSPLRSIDRSRYLRDPQPLWPRYVENDPELETSLIPGFEVSVVDPSDQEDPPSFTPRSPALWRDLDAEYSLRSYADRYRPRVGDNNDNNNRDDVSLTSSESEDEYDPPYHDRGTERHDLDEEFAQQRRQLNNMRMALERGYQSVSSSLPSSRRTQQDWRTIQQSTQRNTPIRPGLRSTDDLPEAVHTHGDAPSKTTADAGLQRLTSTPDTLAPHARFAMAETQTSVAITFDPPVAGRYILIMLWASCPSSTIDIQSIVPYGYGGPRFFPSVEAR